MNGGLSIGKQRHNEQYALVHGIATLSSCFYPPNDLAFGFKGDFGGVARIPAHIGAAVVVDIKSVGFTFARYYLPLIVS